MLVKKIVVHDRGAPSDPPVPAPAAPDPSAGPAQTFEAQLQSLGPESILPMPPKSAEAEESDNS